MKMYGWSANVPKLLAFFKVIVNFIVVLVPFIHVVLCIVCKRHVYRYCTVHYKWPHRFLGFFFNFPLVLCPTSDKSLCSFIVIDCILQLHVNNRQSVSVWRAM